MNARIEKIPVNLQTIYIESKDRRVGGTVVMNNVLKGIERCHNASIEVIINAAAIKINGEKIVL